MSTDLTPYFENNTQKKSPPKEDFLPLILYNF